MNECESVAKIRKEIKDFTKYLKKVCRTIKALLNATYKAKLV